VNGEVPLGRNTDPATAIFDPAQADQFGVSRRHGLLRPTESHLYLLDLGSTNGTGVNGHSIGVNVPYSLTNGDIIRLGRLEFVLKIIQRPDTKPQESRDRAKRDKPDSLGSIACTISSHLELDTVLQESMAMMRASTSADEIAIWLVDEYSGELLLQAMQGSHEHGIHRLRLNDSLAGEVIRTGKPVRVHQDSSSDRIKLKTGYLVSAVIYVPLTVGGVTFGVLSAAHRDAGKMFSDREEQALAFIANITAVAVQNARLYRASQESLTRHIKVVTALRYALSFDMRNLQKAAQGYAGMLQITSNLDEDSQELTQNVLESVNQMGLLSSRLIESTVLCDDPQLDIAPCDLIDLAAHAIESLLDASEAKSVAVDFQVMGELYLIQADYRLLQRAVLALLDNAIKFSPENGIVRLVLAFSPSGTTIQVHDEGPGIPPEDLPYLFSKYIRGPQMPGIASGLGLGLELARTAVRAHHGSIQGRNREEGGAEFTMHLPGKLRM
jgi:K+-sensing histidine kinase KdpD